MSSGRDWGEVISDILELPPKERADRQAGVWEEIERLGHEGELEACRALIVLAAERLGRESPYENLFLADLAIELLGDFDLASKLLSDPRLTVDHQLAHRCYYFQRAAVKRLFIALQSGASGNEVGDLLNDIGRVSVVGSVFDGRSVETIDMLAARGLLDFRSRVLVETAIYRMHLDGLRGRVVDQAKLERLTACWEKCKLPSGPG